MTKGDASVYCIAAASIIAKVTRDRLMHTYDAMWPAYGLAQHKGYPVAKHVAAISKVRLRVQVRVRVRVRVRGRVRVRAP